tara:strand:+ start:469 stop:594 length:126 start_codon:yes stop_codon:yes gene_type:complete
VFPKLLEFPLAIILAVEVIAPEFIVPAKVAFCEALKVKAVS